MKRKCWVLICFITNLCHQGIQGSVHIQSEPVYGDRVVPEYQETEDSDRLPGDNVLPHLNMLNKPVVQEVLAKANANLDQIIKEQEPQPEEVGPENSVIEIPEEPARVLPKKPKKNNTRNLPPVNLPLFEQPALPSAAFSSRNAQVFSENAHFANRLSSLPTVSLPSNSTAAATLMAGLKVRPGSEMRLPIRIDYAFLGPNKAVVEMTGCEAFVTVNADLNVSRLYGELGNISCRAPKGETFNIPMRAHLIDQNDNYVGIEGTTVLNGKGAAALMSFLSDGTSAFGKAMSAAQVSTQVQTTPEGAGVSGANVSGDKDKYIAGQTIAGATGKFLNWSFEFYQSMQPTVEVASGRKVFLLTDGEAQIPKIFFAKTDDLSAKNRINTNKTLMSTGATKP